MDIGNARLGMSVAERLRKNKKITRTTRHTVNTSVNSTSWTDWRMDSERSKRISRLMAGGRWSRKCGSRFLIASTTFTVLTPGWRWTVSTMARLLFDQLANLLFFT